MMIRLNYLLLILIIQIFSLTGFIAFPEWLSRQICISSSSCFIAFVVINNLERSMFPAEYPSSVECVTWFQKTILLRNYNCLCMACWYIAQPCFRRIIFSFPYFVEVRIEIEKKRLRG